MVENKQTYKCPFCESNISKEQYNKVIQENELLKKKAKELEEKIIQLETEKTKLQERIKKAVNEEKAKAQKKIIQLEAEKTKLQSKIKDAVNKEKINVQKLQLEIKKLKDEKAKFKEQIKDVRRKEKQNYAEKLERDSRIIEKLRKENELLKKGMSAQDMGFEFENKMHEWLKIKFDKDYVEKTGKKGDSLIRVKNNGKEVGIILIECKKKDTITKADFDEVKRHKLESKANVGVLVTNGYLGKKTKMDGFRNIGGVLVIRPHSALEFIELLREHIVEIDHLKISGEEKNKEMTRLWEFIHSPAFESQMNSILQNVNKLKELDATEYKILEKRETIEDNILKAHKLILDGIIRTRKI